MIKRILKRTVDRLRGMVDPPIKQAHGIDYTTYRTIQNEGFRRKIDVVFVRQRNIEHIARFAERRGSVCSVLCHGTRNGSEQKFFKAAVPGARVLGTEIGEGAARFPDTVEWDFHDMKPEWTAAWDVIYSNSWDHALEPERAFKTWVSCLSPNGILVLEHTELHTPRHVDELDVFGASFNGLIGYLDEVLPPSHKIVGRIVDLPETPNEQKAVVIARA